MFFLSTMAMVITGSVFWGCTKDEVRVLSENEQVILKSGTLQMEKECEAYFYSLVTQNNRKVGHIVVSNDQNFLNVEFVGNGLSVSEVQLWVGSDPSMVPKNSKNIPVPGKFPFKDSGSASFQIPLSDLIIVPPGGFNGMEVYIYAHAEFGNSASKGNEEISAWSEGTSFGTSRWGSYSTYILCGQPGGCFPHLALGGNTFESGVYYYNNTGEGGGLQDIHTDNGKVAGTVQYTSGTLSFYFDQEWMFSDLLPAPMLLVYGYNEQPGSDPILVFEGEPTFNQGSVTVPVSNYNYYKIQLNLQECY